MIMKRLRRVSTFLILIIAVGVLTIFAWVYAKYFKGAAAPAVTFTAEQGDITEKISARGEVVSEREIDMAFLESGLVESVFVKEGDTVEPGDALVKLDTRDHELEASGLEAVLAQRQAALDKLVAGATPETIAIAKTKVANASLVAGNAKKTLVAEIKEAYTAADDAVRNKIDPLYTNPRSTNPRLAIPINDTQMKLNLESTRAQIEYALVAWAGELPDLATADDLQGRYDAATGRLETIRTFLGDMAFAVNSLLPNGSLTQATIDTWKANVAAARTGLETAIAGTADADDALRVAAAAQALAEDELADTLAGTRPEDLAAARAQVEETQNSLLAAREKIRKATLYAPIAAQVMDLPLDEGETYTVGNTAISLSATAVKLQADVSELEIGKINNAGGNRVEVKFDAFPGENFMGTLTNVEPKEVVKDGDKYYRVNIYLDETARAIRPGMSADLAIAIETHQNAVKIPEFIVYRRDGKQYVMVEEQGRPVEREIETGVSDGENIEVVSGLQPGETVVAAAE
jgi:HlyD family secretion protein